MIEHRHVWIFFDEKHTPAELHTMRVNGSENKYQIKDITFSSKSRLELLLKNWTPYVSFHNQMVFLDAVKIK
jgi:hypothetical protein